MTWRQAKKILNGSSRWPETMKPSNAKKLGLMPWKWSTWSKAHRVFIRGIHGK